MTELKLRLYDNDKDFEAIRNWVIDERTHAMWCANLFNYPLDKNNVAEVLAFAYEKYGDRPFILTTADGELACFLCFSLKKENKEVMLKFIVVNPEFRGKGIAQEMLKTVREYIFTNTEAELVQLMVFPENIRAKKCYEKAGFTERSLTENAFNYKDESWGRCNMIFRKTASDVEADPVERKNKK